MRFPYAPPSLFLTALVERLPLEALRVLHLVSWLVLAGTVAICVRLFRRSMAEGEGSTGAGQLDRVAGPVLVAAFTLTFYPVEGSVRLHLAADPFFTVPGIFVEVLPPDDARVGAAWAFLWSSHPAADPSGGPPR